MKSLLNTDARIPKTFHTRFFGSFELLTWNCTTNLWIRWSFLFTTYIIFHMVFRMLRKSFLCFKWFFTTLQVYLWFDAIWANKLSSVSKVWLQIYSQGNWERFSSKSKVEISFWMSFSISGNVIEIRNESFLFLISWKDFS